MSYLFQRSISVDPTKCGTADSTNFPVLISGTFSYLADVAHGGKVQNASGFDIGFFSDIALTTKLSWEVEKYVPATGEIEAWVRVSTLSHTVNTVIYLAYSDATISTFQGSVTGTWNANAKGIWHFPNGTSLNVSDSTGLATSVNSGATAVVGQVDGGAGFDGTNHIDTGASSPYDFEYNQAWSVSAWYKPNVTRSGAGAAYVIFGKESNTSPNPGWLFGVLWDGTSKTVGRFAALNNVNTPHYFFTRGTADIPNGSWIHIVATYDGSDAATGQKYYLNGTQDTTVVDTDTLGANSIHNAFNANIGGNNNPFNNTLNGSLDEVHVWSGALSTSWITSEYNNQLNPSTFYTVGVEVLLFPFYGHPDGRTGQLQIQSLLAL